jgi:hypothetical protein
MVAYSDPLPGQPYGIMSTTGTVNTFAATRTKIYRLSGMGWVDVTRTTGGDYSTPADGRWRFVQFGNRVIATNRTDPPQSFVIGTSSNFAALAGSPPNAAIVGRVRDFVVLGSTTSSPQQVAWSGIDNPETWTPSQSTQADFQTMPDGGEVVGIVGGDYGVIFQQRAVTRMQYVGAPTIFQFDQVEANRGVLAEGSIAGFGTRQIFYLSDDGFYRTDGNGPSVPIGANKINATFLADLDRSFLSRVYAAIDPINQLYICCYPGRNNNNGRPNKLIIYHFGINEWSFADIEMETITQIAASGYSLEDLTNVLGFTNIETVPFSFDSRTWQGGAISLGNFNSDYRLSYFTGPTLPAEIETGEVEFSSPFRTVVSEVWPYVDAGTPTVTVGRRIKQELPIVYTGVMPINPYGFVPVRAEGRYHRIKVQIPGGTNWTHAQGIDVRFTSTMRR